MDIHQLRSWIFELYEPLTDERTYVILHDHDGVLVDLPPYSRRVAISIRGICDPRLVFFTHAHRGADIERWRAAMPEVEYVVHEADAAAIGPVHHTVADGDRLTPHPETRVVHIGARTAGHSMLLAKVPGGVLFAGDGLAVTPKGTLALPDERYASDESIRAGLAKLAPFEFSAVLTAHGHPVWNAAKERYLELMRELPRQRKRFGHLIDAPWDREYLRVRAQMSKNPLVPAAETIEEAAGHGPSTLVPAWERAPVREVTWPPASGASSAGAPPSDGKKWSLAKEAARSLPPSAPRAVQTLPWELTASPVTFRRLAASELAEIATVDRLYRSFDLSADGREAVFAWDRTGTYEIYRAPVTGDEIFQLTQGVPARSVQPRIAPDGGAVAFLRDGGADESFDVWLVDRDGRRERRLTDRPAMRGEIAWSPDSRALAYVTDEDGALGIVVLDVASGRRRSVARDLRVIEDLEVGPSWSHDGRFIAYQTADAAANVDVHLAPADGSGTSTRLDTRGGATGQSRQPRFSSDDGTLAFATDVRGRWEIAVVPVADGKASGPVRLLREGHFDETDPVWDADARKLLYRRSADAIVSVRRAFLVSNDDEPALDAPGVHYAVRVRPEGGLVYHWSGAREPADVWAKGVEDVVPHRVTRSLPGAIASGLFVEPRHVRYPSADRTEIPALLYLPHREAVDGERATPAVVVAHGGPARQHLADFDVWAQWFVNRGYAVLAPNVRGSTGYGRAFREASRGDLGGRDVDDLVAGAEWLATEGIADGERIAAFGVSYGGYLTLMALARAPRRFAAGCEIAGPTSTRPFLAASRPHAAGALRLYVDGLDDAALRERSPIALVDRVRAPVLILHGRADERVPVGEAERLVEELRKRGKAFSFHAYDAGHLLVSRDDRRDALERVGEFFDEHVRERGRAVLGPA